MVYSVSGAEGSCLNLNFSSFRGGDCVLGFVLVMYIWEIVRGVCVAFIRV